MRVFRVGRPNLFYLIRFTKHFAMLHHRSKPPLPPNQTVAIAPPAAQKALGKQHSTNTVTDDQFRAALQVI